MKYKLKKELTKPIEIIPKIEVIKLTASGIELEERLKYYLSNFMKDTLDPDIDFRKPEVYIDNLQRGRLGDFSTRYITIAYNNDTPVGILIGILEGKHYLHIYTLGVMPSYRKTGVASSMLTKCINDMIRNGVKELILDVHSDNKPAYELYKKFGFK